ncbi:hypothetical protein PCANC_02174 [Puccinia coronata f. sp. avenae]|uniref:Uncharacterized protein n=1 Tax=Puccinia coronata f. sp. avenae TaxID=200324 RepID=A0A2N5W0U8_9BASI|nr:hypothetical protein PCANC_02174 [Puccinia coronata f. sp. avenae]
MQPLVIRPSEPAKGQFGRLPTDVSLNSSRPHYDFLRQEALYLFVPSRRVQLISLPVRLTAAKEPCKRNKLYISFKGIISPVTDLAVKRSRGNTSYLARQESTDATGNQSARERPQASLPTGSRGKTKASKESPPLPQGLLPHRTKQTVVWTPKLSEQVAILGNSLVAHTLNSAFLASYISQEQTTQSCS